MNRENKKNKKQKPSRTSRSAGLLLIINNVKACLKFHLPKDIGSCNSCGQQLTEIRGRFPGQPKRKVCACCVTEKLEQLESDQNGPVSNKNG